jgi:hypothetical protein
MAKSKKSGGAKKAAKVLKKVYEQGKRDGVAQVVRTKRSHSSGHKRASGHKKAKHTSGPKKAKHTSGKKAGHKKYKTSKK